MHSPFRVAVAGALSLIAVAAHAELIYGVSQENDLVSFDSENTAAVTTIGNLSGVEPGFRFRSIAFRPQDGVLYGLAANIETPDTQLYRISLTDATVTSVGEIFRATSGGVQTGFAFDPTNGSIRAVNSAGGHYRLNPDTGSIDGDYPELTYDPSLGIEPRPELSDIAYKGGVAYGIDYLTRSLVTIGGNGRTIDSGVVQSVGPLGYTPYSRPIGFDISSVSGIGYVAFDDNDSPTEGAEFYTVDFSTGTLTRRGYEMSSSLVAIAVSPQAVPEPASFAVLGIGAAALIRRRRKL